MTDAARDELSGRTGQARDPGLNAAAAVRLIPTRHLLDLPGGDRIGIASHRVAGAEVWDCGSAVPANLTLGELLVTTSTGGRLACRLGRQRVGGYLLAAAEVRTDDPLAACLLGQYAGWQVKTQDWFGMLSGPVRAAAATEVLFTEMDYREAPEHAVGVLEAATPPTVSAVKAIRDELPATVQRLTLLVAPTASLAGTYQVVARSVETAMHKLHHLGVDVRCVQSAFGSAPLPPIPRDDLTAIGRTNDAILYGGEVTLFVDADDDAVADWAPKLPSCASEAHGRPFLDLFREAGGDFYAIDPLLFSPAAVTVNNLRTGSCRHFGAIDKDLLARSFF